MADLLKFVDYLYSQTGGTSGSVLLDINDGTNYCLDEIEFPIPKPSIEWREPKTTDGREPSFSKWENREINIKLQVYGTSESDLYDNARALWAELLEANPILLWQADDSADMLFFDVISPPLEINTDDWFVTQMRDFPKLIVMPNVEIALEAKPFARGPEETIVITEALGENDNFEDWTGAQCDHWTKTETNAGTVTKTVAAGEFLVGLTAVKLTTTAGGTDVAAITDTDYIAVDATKHYNVRFYTKEISGTSKIDVDVACYDAGNNLLGTLNMLVADRVSTSWEDPIEKSTGGTGTSTGVIHPAGSADAYKFPAGTTKVKRTIRNDAAVASVVVVDAAFFGISEYYTRAARIGAYHANRVENPACVHIPSTDLKGDVPAPSRLFLDNHDDQEGSYGSFEIAITGCYESTANPTLIITPTSSPGAVPGTFADEVNHLDQRYFQVTTDPDTTYFDPEINVEDHVGRYIPIAKLRYSVDSPQYTTYILGFFLRDGTSTIGGAGLDLSTVTLVTTDNQWLINGDYNGAAEYLTVFEPVDIPPRALPFDADLSNITVDFSLYSNPSSAGTNYVEYIMFVPEETFMEADLDNTYRHTGYLVDGYTENLYVDGTTIAASPYYGTGQFKDMDRHVDGVKGSPTSIVYPKGTNIVFGMLYRNSLTFGLSTNGREGHPQLNPNVYLYYRPYYLVVPEA